MAEKSVSFEDACAMRKDIMTPETIANVGLQGAVRLYQEALIKVGWTIKELSEESARRVIERFKK